MSRAIDEKGKRYGQLIVLERAGNYRGREAIWKCLCDCGEDAIVPGSALRTGNTKSCGCLRIFPSGVAAGNALFLSYKQQSGIRLIKWELDRDTFLLMTSSECYYCGKEPAQIKSGPSYNGDYIYNGLDRVDNSKGYKKTNVVPCCWGCNNKKRNLSVPEILNFAEKIKEHIDACSF